MRKHHTSDLTIFSSIIIIDPLTVETQINMNLIVTNEVDHVFHVSLLTTRFPGSLQFSTYSRRYDDGEQKRDQASELRLYY